jgi:hypothetical protein
MMAIDLRIPMFVVAFILAQIFLAMLLLAFRDIWKQRRVATIGWLFFPAVIATLLAWAVWLVVHANLPHD